MLKVDLVLTYFIIYMFWLYKDKKIVDSNFSKLE